jgi:hypothetical protein
VVSNEVKAKLDRCMSFISSKYPQGVDYEVLLGELAELFLERSMQNNKVNTAAPMQNNKVNSDILCFLL